MSLGGSLKTLGKGTANNVMSSALDAAIQLGKAALHAAAPDDYEYYLCSFELLNIDGKQEGFLSFVVMPEQLVENHMPIQSTNKTHNGIVTTINPSFAPVDISIAGTFGKKFRIVSMMKDPKNNSFFGLNIGKIGKVANIKSGYGMTKILEHILEKTTQLDERSRPYFLIFNNYALNTSYVVNVTNYAFQQSMANNMMWYYQVQLQAVADATAIKNHNWAQFLTTVAATSIANGVNNVAAGMIRNIGL